MTASRNASWLLLAFALALASGALAQAPGGPGSRAGGAGNRGLGGQPGRLGDASGPNMVELVTMRLGQLEEDLNLQPNQLALWNAYRDRVMRMLDDHRRALRAASAYTAVGHHRAEAARCPCRRRAQPAYRDRGHRGCRQGALCRADAAAAHARRSPSRTTARHAVRQRHGRGRAAARRAAVAGERTTAFHRRATVTVLYRRRPESGVKLPAKRSCPESTSPSTCARALRIAPSVSTNVKPSAGPSTYAPSNG